jgi:uncharacterized protein (TIRG00374 family)
LKIKVTIGIVISAVFIYLTFRQVDLQEMAAAFQHGRHFWLIPAFLVMLASHWLRALRWQFIMNPFKKLSLSSLFSALMIGYATNNVFPLRMGELIRAYAIGKSQKVSKSAAFATIVVERFILDLTALLIILGTTLAFSPVQLPFHEDIKKGGYIILAVVLVMLCIIFFIMEQTGPALRIIRRLMPEKIYHFIEHTLLSFVEGCLVFKKSDHYIGIVISTLAIWALYIFSLVVTFKIFDFAGKYDLTVWHADIILVIVTFAIMLPSSPGAIGTFHYLCTKVLEYYGIPNEEAVAFAVVSHALNILPFTLIGLIYFWKENLHFSEVLAQKADVESESESDFIAEQSRPAN